jgi:hypothetical protein
MGACTQTATYSGSAVADSRTLKIKVQGAFPATGDLLLAVVTGDGAVTPPRGWSSYLSGSGTGGSVQIFYKVAGQLVPGSYTFTSGQAQRMTGVLLDVMGVSAHDPIASGSAAAAVSRSRTVTAPSIRASFRQSLLVFVGTTQARVRWTAPQGMKPIYLDPYGTQKASRLGIAIQRWHPASATGSRTAQISKTEGNSGQLIALHYPQPITCPKVKVLSRRFRPNRRGILFVKMHCQWTATCRGAFEGVDLEDHFPTPKIAASDFTIPAGQTRSVPIATTRAGFKALKRHHKLAFDIYVWAYTAANQIVIAGDARGKIRAPAS